MPKKWKDKKQIKKEETEKRQNKKGEDLSAEFLADLKKSGELCTMQKVDFIPTGSLVLNKIIGDGTLTNSPGGFPRGYVSELFGDESTGKTTIGLLAAKNAIAAGGRVVWADFEHNLRAQKTYIERLGLVAAPPHFIPIIPKNFEDGVDRIGQALFKLKPAPSLIVIDSVTAMMPKANVESAAGQSVQIGKHAKLTGEFLNWITKYLDSTNTALLLLNQTRVDIAISSMPGHHGGPKEQSSGGKAPRFFTAVRIQLKQTGIKETVSGVSSITGEVGIDKAVSQAVKAICVKNKFDIAYKSGPIYIAFGKGVDNIMSLIILGENTKVLKKVDGGSWISWEDPDKKYTFKVQGRIKLEKYLEENPDTLKALMPYLVPSESTEAKLIRKDELESIGVDNLDDKEKAELADLKKQLKNYKPEDDVDMDDVTVETPASEKTEKKTSKEEAALKELGNITSSKKALKEEDIGDKI